MGINLNIFDYLGRKVESATLDSVALKAMEQVALKEIALHIGISYIANALSKCEFKTYEQGKLVKGELYYLLNVSPNPNENASQFVNKIVEEYYWKGHALVVPIDGHIYCADSFHVDTTRPLNGYVFDSIAFGSQQKAKKYKSKDVFYFKLDNKNVKTMIDSLYKEYGAVMAQALRSYKKSNGEKYILERDAYAAGDKKFKEDYEKVLKEQLKSFLENDNSFMVQNKGVSLNKQKNDTVKDTSDVVSLRKEVFEIVAQALKIPLSMMNGNITNMDEIVKVFLSFCADPLADMISEEITRKNYSYDEWKEGTFVQLDTSCINHVDILEVAQALYNAIGSGAANIDDMRNRLGWQPLDTEFSKEYFLSKNFVPATEMLNATSESTVEGGEK